MGKQHRICEDYVANSNNIIVVSDGCSSSKKTDVGSRILSHLILSEIGKVADFDSGVFLALSKAEEIRLELGLPETSLDGTIGILQRKDNRIFAKFFGDGVLLVKYKNGVTTVDSIVYDNEMPYYISYDLSKSRLDQYAGMSIGETLHVYSYAFAEDKVEKNVQNYAYYHRPEFEVEVKDIEYVLICTDGVKSFIDENQKGLVIDNVVKELTDFKGFKGEFLKRRINFTLRGYKKIGVYNFDDLGIGAMYVGDEE